MSVCQNLRLKSVSRGGKAGSVPRETGIRKHRKAAMFRILSRSLKQRTGKFISDNVHSMAHGGEKDIIFLYELKENWARPSGLGKALKRRQLEQFLRSLTVRRVYPKVPVQNRGHQIAIFRLT